MWLMSTERCCHCTMSNTQLLLYYIGLPKHNDSVFSRERLLTFKENLCISLPEFLYLMCSLLCTKNIENTFVEKKKEQRKYFVNFIMALIHYSHNYGRIQCLFCTVHSAVKKATFPTQHQH